MFEAKFIAIDGPDGCGKSTQTKLLAKYLNEKNVKVENLRDPGSTDISEKIRNILLDTKNITMCDMTEMLLYMAARTQLYTQCIEPALKQGKCAILDRWISSTYAYQGYAGKIGGEKILNIAEQCLKRTWPDVTVILDAKNEDCQKRMNRKRDRMELKGKKYHDKVRMGFLDFATKHDNVIVVDASKTIENVNENVIEKITECLKKNKIKII